MPAFPGGAKEEQTVSVPALGLIICTECEIGVPLFKMLNPWFIPPPREDGAALSEDKRGFRMSPACLCKRGRIKLRKRAARVARAFRVFWRHIGPASAAPFNGLSRAEGPRRQSLFR